MMTLVFDDAARLAAAAVLVCALAAPARAAQACDRDTVETAPAAALAPCARQLADAGLGRPERAALLRLRAKAHDRQGQLREALTDHDAALALTPDDADLMISRAWTLWAMGRSADVSQALRKALETNPGHARVNHMLGFARMVSGQHDGAVVAFSEALRSDPKHPMSLMHRAQSLHALKRYSDSLRDADALLALGKPLLDRQLQRNVGGKRASMYADARYRRGKALAELGRPQEALREYLDAQAHGEVSNYWLSSAHVRYYDLKDDKGAFADLDALLARDPRDAYALKRYAQFLLGRKQHREALAFLDRLVALDSSSAEAHVERAIARKHAGDRDGAVKDYLVAYRLSEPYRAFQSRKLASIGYLKTATPPSAGSREIADALGACVIDPGCQ